MSSRWEQAKEIVADALELNSAAERHELIHSRCNGDKELRADVESLLDQSTTGFDQCVDRSSVFRATDGVTLGEMIGAYEIERELGRGGMGAVYLASRADGVFDKRVAIKVLKRGMDTDEVLRRFNVERRILAQLDHPNIAQLLDGGTTSSGLPYFVMEYVDGIPVTRFIAERQLSLSERLGLFRTICDAVSYAHRNLVVHRDLKPSNILVTSAIRIKLLDFGIAKLLQGTGDDRPEVTVTSFRVMTPEYASPEQLKGEPVTTQTDVYSLGIILYEMLTGTRPYRLTTRTPHEMAETIATREAERPSTTAARLANQGVRLEVAAKDLRGDLDNIVLQSLRLEARRRYGSVNEFSEDVRRFLEGMPVKARRDTTGYRVSKFVQRHKLGVAAALTILFLLSGAMLITLFEAQQARREKLEAQQRFNEVRQVAHSLLFDYHDDIAKLPGSTQLRERLVKDAMRYLDNLSHSAGNDTDLLRELGTAYERLGAIQGNSYFTNLGDTTGSLNSYERSLAIRRRVIELSGSSAETQDDLAASHEGIGDVYSEMGKLQDALTHYRDAGHLREQVLASRPEKAEYVLSLAELYSKIGDVQGMDGYANLGDTAGALETYTKEIALLQKAGAANASDRRFKSKLADAFSHSGMLADSAGDIATALRDGRRAVELLEELSAADPTNHNYRIVLLAANAFLRFSLVDANKIDEAIERMKKTVTELEAMVAADPKNIQPKRSLAVSYNALGKDIAQRGDVAGGMAYVEMSRSIVEALLSSNGSSEAYKADMALTLSRLGELQVAAGDRKAARTNFMKAIELRNAALATDPANARARAELAVVYQDLGELDTAEGNGTDADNYFSKSIELGEALTKESPTNAKRAATLAARYLAIAGIRLKRGDAATARAELERSRAIWEQLRRRNAILPCFEAQSAEVVARLEELDRYRAVTATH